MPTVLTLAVLTAALLLPAGTAAAQGVPFQLAPDNPPPFEIAAQVGWQSVRKHEFDSWNDRYDTGFAGVSIGYFWTPNVKAEVTVGRSGRGLLYRTELIGMRDRMPIYQSFEHTFETTSIAPALTYQFLRNQWIHPFVTAGADVSREDYETFAHETGVRMSGTTVSAAPFVGAGAKVFVSERAFIRTDVRTMVTGDETQRTSWTAGVGVEF